jgi:hypothetical protein
MVLLSSFWSKWGAPALAPSDLEPSALGRCCDRQTSTGSSEFRVPSSELEFGSEIEWDIG